MNYYQIFKNVIFHLYHKKISSGPFKNMRYVNTAHGSALLPKIAGTYEREIQEYIPRIVNKRYDIIIDVGAAEGYYAVGLAYLYQKAGYKDVRIYAFDHNTAAHKTLHKLSALNNTQNYIETRTYCDHKTLNSLLNNNTFILCDIEGGETELLDPLKVEMLYHTDMLVELHDGKEDFITEEFRKRFKDSHEITVINFEPRKSTDGLSWLLHPKFKLATVREGRKRGLKWMYLERNVRENLI